MTWFALILTLPASAASLEIKVPSVRVPLAAEQPRSLPLAVRDSTPKPITIWSAGFWPNHSIHLTDSAGNPVPRTRRGGALQAIFDDPHSPRDKNVPIRIAKGATYSYATPPIRLGDLFVCRPGHYRLAIIYWERSEGKPLKMESSPVHVIIE